MAGSRSSRRRLGATLAASAAALLVAELAVRAAPERFGLPSDWSEPSAPANFEARPHLLYTHRSAAEATNGRGFNAPAWPGERQPDTLRVLALGASTTESGNEQGFGGSFPAYLEAGLNQYLGDAPESRRVEVVNLGMAGWTTAESLVHWFLAAKDLAPDLVLIHHAVNDVAPRMWPGFRSDYAHYRQPFELRPRGGLARVSALFAALAGRAEAPTLDDAVVRPLTSAAAALAPAGRATFRRNVLSIGRDARAEGAAVCLITLPVAPRETFPSPDLDLYREGVAEHNDVLREVAAAEDFMLADLDALARGEEADNPLLSEAFIDLVHVSPDGNLWKALAVGAALSRQWEPLVAVERGR